MDVYLVTALAFVKRLLIQLLKAFAVSSLRAGADYVLRTGDEKSASIIADSLRREDENNRNESYAPTNYNNGNYGNYNSGNYHSQYGRNYNNREETFPGFGSA